MARTIQSKPDDATMTGTPKLDDEFIAQVKLPIVRTFHMLLDSSFDFENMSRRDAMEMAIDAAYMTTHGYPRADDLVGEACKAHGYEKTLRFLVKNIRL
jgi:hypothetical protein